MADTADRRPAVSTMRRRRCSDVPVEGPWPGNRDNARWHRARGCQRRWAELRWPRTWSGSLGIADATGLMFGQGMRFHHNWIRNLHDDA
jgi:hypothetical protein